MNFSSQYDGEEDGGSLGTSFDIPTNLTTSLKKQRDAFLSNKASSVQDGLSNSFSEKLTFLSPAVSNNETIANSEQIGFQNGADENNDDNDIMFFQPLEQDKSEGEEESTNDSEGNNCGSDQHETDDDSVTTTVSVSPPPNLPILIIDLKRVYGYLPTNDEEINKMKQEIKEELLGKKETSSIISENEKEVTETDSADVGDGTSLDFISRSSILFESDIALHASAPYPASSGKIIPHNLDLSNNDLIEKILYEFALDTASDQNNRSKIMIQQHLIVPYPEFIYDPHTCKAIPLTKIWKYIIQDHSIPVVQQLLAHLQKTSQPLLWKYEMAQEIRAMAKAQERKKEEKEQRNLLRKWKTETRPEQLEKLYEVRETFEQKLEEAQDQLNYLERLRDKVVKQKMIEYVKKVGDDSELMDVLHLGQGEFLRSVDDLFLGKDTDRDDTYESDVSSHQTNSDVGDEIYDASDEDNNIVAHEKYNETELDNEKESPDKSILPALPDRKKHQEIRAARRHRKSSKRLKRQLKQQAHRAKLAARKEKIDAAKREEVKIRHDLTSSDIKMAQFVVNTMKLKYNQVDTLLETLQEEEWADAEEQYDDVEIGSNVEDPSDTIREGRSTLMDQILAMILGKLPRSHLLTKKEYYSKIESEHVNIVRQWKEYFGELPKASSSFTENVGDKENGDRLMQETVNSVKKDFASIRSALGISENEGEADWDELNWEKVLPEEIEHRKHEEEKLAQFSTTRQDSSTFNTQLASGTTANDSRSSSNPNPRSIRVGLRPGGRVS